MHGPINVKSPNNTSKRQMGLNSAFKGLNDTRTFLRVTLIFSCFMFFCTVHYDTIMQKNQRMHNFINQYFISEVSYLFRTSWVQPQEDSCICSMVCFTCIGLSSMVGRRVCWIQTYRGSTFGFKYDIKSDLVSPM
jgi:hypothetical protein